MPAPLLTLKQDEVLVSVNNRSGMAGEQFRRMRIRIEGLRESLGGSMKVIVVTSPMMGEGKTTTAINLALSLSQEDGRKVLLVDCDMRKPRVHSFFTHSPSEGLGDVLAAGAPLDRAVAKIEGTNLSTLVLPRGADRRIDPLPVDRLRVAFYDMRARYDFVVCDAPPILPIADTASLARLADGIVMVVRAGITPRQAVARSLSTIDRQKMIGFVLNAVPERALDRYYYGYTPDVAENGGGRKKSSKKR